MGAHPEKCSGVRCAACAFRASAHEKAMSCRTASFAESYLFRFSLGQSWSSSYNLNSAYTLTLSWQNSNYTLFLCNMRNVKLGLFHTNVQRKVFLPFMGAASKVSFIAYACPG